MFDNHKTRMIGLPCGEKTITIFSVVFTEYEDATDEKTDRWTDRISLVNMLMRIKT